MEGQGLSRSASSLWDEMLDELRALGGVADNVCIKVGRFGRGLFPVDPAKPIRVHIPDNLLVDPKHVTITDGALRIRPEAGFGACETAFWESYQQDFSWGPGRRDTDELLQMVHDAPEELRELLRTVFGAGLWLGSLTPESNAERFLATRVIAYKGGHVVMPIVELTNHGHGTRYETEEGGVGLSGQFAGEVLVRYGFCDPLDLFLNWGFASDAEDIALSLRLRNDHFGLAIKREDLKADEEAKPVPKIGFENGKLTFSHLLLGHRKMPRLARGIFYRIMQNAGRSDAEEVFDMIQHYNRMQMYRLIAASEGAAPPLGRLLRTVARHQLEIMSNNIGTREV